MGCLVMASTADARALAAGEVRPVVRMGVVWDGEGDSGAERVCSVIHARTRRVIQNTSFDI